MGMYDPNTGIRLPVTTQPEYLLDGDRILLAVVQVEAGE
jgi:hypothetical protein